MFQALESRLPSYSIPHQTKNNTQSWLFCGETYSCVPDVSLPADPNVIRVLRESVPSVQPLTIRTTWRRSWTHGAEEMVTVRHGVAHYFPDLRIPAHNFDCVMPSVEDSELPLQKPNYIEVNYYDGDVRPYGFDMPGAYLPFDWQLYYQLMEARRPDIVADEYVDKEIVEPRRKDEEMAAAQREVEDKYVDDEIDRMYAKALNEASDAEIIDALIGTPGPREKKIRTGYTKAPQPIPGHTTSRPLPLIAPR